MSSDAQALQPAVENPHWWEKTGVLEIALLGVSALVFLATLSFGFVYDDRVQVLENPFLRSWHYLAHDFTSHVWAHTHNPAVYYRPVFLVWLRLNYTLFGDHAWGWHLTTVLLHGVVTLLVFRLAWRLLGKRWPAAVAALIYAVHPVHVENVAWVSGGVDPLLSLFFVGSLLCYLRWRERSSPTWMAGSLLLALLAMLTKETGVTLPAVVLAYAWLFGAERVGPRLRETIVQTAPFALLAVLYLLVRHAVLGAPPPNVNPYGSVLFNLPGLLWFYLRLLVWPAGLSLFYPREYMQHPTFGNLVLPILLLAMVAACLWTVLRRNPAKRQAAFSIAFTLITLSPALWTRWFPIDDFVHDRYLYLPSVGFALLAAIVVQKLGGKASEDWIAPPRQVAVVSATAVALIVGCIAAQLFWANDLLLWFHCYKHAPHNQVVLNNLASSLGERGEFGRAVPLFHEVLRENPNNADAQGNLGYTYYQMGDLAQAEEHLARAVQLDPYDAHSQLFLGITLYKQGDFRHAESPLSRAIQLDPSAKGAHLALALVLEKLGDIEGATRELRAELASHPDEEGARDLLQQLQTRDD